MSFPVEPTAPSRSPAPSKPSDILEAAAALIEPEGRWTQRYYAKRPDGEPLYSATNLAFGTCWCVLGSIGMASGLRTDSEIMDSDATIALGRYLDLGESIADWNDAPERTQAEVVAKLREAAALAREAGQ